MDLTLSEADICEPKRLIVGHVRTMVGYCVNVRDLGKLAFFTLRSQTWSLQVVCAAKHVIDELRSIDDYSLVEVTGTIQEKHRRRERDSVEHELNARTLTRVGQRAASSARRVGDSSRAQNLFKSVQPIVHGAQLIKAVRKVLADWDVTELPPPDSLEFIDEQALASFEHARRSMARAPRYCPYPPFHARSQLLAAGGLYRFAFCSNAVPGCQLLHIALCRSRSGEMQAILGELLAAMFGDNEGRRQSMQLKNGDTPVDRAGSRVGARLIDSSEQCATRHRRWTACPELVDVPFDAGAQSTTRDRELSLGFGVTQRVVHHRNGAAIGHSCTLLHDFSSAEQAAAALGATAEAVAAWRHILDVAVVQPIPRMSMLTLVINDQCSAADVAVRHAKAGFRVAAFDPHVDPADGGGLNQIRIAQMAQLEETEQLRIELEILRGRILGAGKMVYPMALEAALEAIKPVLPAYNLQLDLVHRLLAISTRIHPEWRMERPIDLFQTLWTLLGNTAVRSLLDRSVSEAEGLGRLIEYRILTDKKQMLYVYPAVLSAIDALLNGSVGDERGALIVKLRTLIAQRPTLFATAVQTLARSQTLPEKKSGRVFDELLRSVELGIATPLLVGLTSRIVEDAGQVALLRHALRKTGETVFPNDVLQLTDVAATFVRACPHDMIASVRDAGLSVSPELGREVLYYLYRPLTMDYAGFCDTLSRLHDRTKDWTMWDIGGHGEFWNEALRCYEYWLDRGAGRIEKLRLYASKNVASFFAKSTAGICTDTNIELFNRSDHYHLNIVDADDGRAAGNVQLYVGDGDRGRFLLVRGINPIQGFCVNGGVDALVRCIVHAICDMAAFGGFCEVRLSEQNGLWNSDSSRAEVRACLKRLCAGMLLEPMEEAFHLYNYHDRALTASAYYRIWESSPGHPRAPLSTDGLML